MKKNKTFTGNKKFNLSVPKSDKVKFNPFPVAKMSPEERFIQWSKIVLAIIGLIILSQHLK